MEKMIVDDLTLEELIGKSSFGSIYLSTKQNNPKKYATKRFDRNEIEKDPKILSYLKHEIIILKNLKHPNIIKFEELKKTTNHYYIIMEYCNGGDLSQALKKYQEKYGKSFNEEIVQYFMRQIINAFKYIHGKKVIHRDIKLENILLNYENEEDKKNLNLLKATIKIIDFGFSCRMDKSSLKYTVCGTPLNMDPRVFLCNLQRMQLGYDMKADVWSLGTICYEMLIGKHVFDTNSMREFIYKIQNGGYKVPTNLSLEVISFLNAMLQYNPHDRLNTLELSKHVFLTRDIKDFHSIDIQKISENVHGKILNLNAKKKLSFWAIFQFEDEERLTQIKGNQFYKTNNEKDNKNSSNNDNKNEIKGPMLPDPNEGIPGNSQQQIQFEN